MRIADGRAEERRRLDVRGRLGDAGRIHREERRGLGGDLVVVLEAAAAEP